MQEITLSDEERERLEGVMGKTFIVDYRNGTEAGILLRQPDSSLTSEEVD